MKLTSSNYFDPKADHSFWSVSSFKAFDRCEAAGLASVEGRYKRETTDALLIGSYVDAYFSGEMDEFRAAHEAELFKKNGELYAKYEHANRMINAVECQPLMMEFLEGDKQVIRTATEFGVPWKIKMDVHYDHEWVDSDGVVYPGRIVDFKTVRDFEPLYKEGFGRMSWVEYWGYDIQGAVYQRIEQISSQRAEPLPFYIVAVTKEKVPDIGVFRLPQHMLDTALKVVDSKIDEFDLVKTGEVPPIRCEHCEWCKQSKILTEPSVYEVE